MIDLKTTRRKFLKALGIFGAAVGLNPLSLLKSGKPPVSEIPKTVDELMFDAISAGTNVIYDDLGGQRGYVGWKSYHTSAVLNENWMANIEKKPKKVKFKRIVKK
jgi:hypothetical protein